MEETKQYLAEPQVIHSGWGMILSLENGAWLNEQRGLHNTADQKGKTECQQCGWCCLRKPCRPTPIELERIAEYLGMSPYELIKTKCVIDDSSGGDYYVLWAQETQLDLLAQYMPTTRTYDRGYCIFFDRENHNCQIHEVRPETARQSGCWITDKKPNNHPEPDGWSEEKILSYCPDAMFNEEE